MSSLERIVDEGLLIALSSVRMAVKNDIIIGALREHVDFDPYRYGWVARNELHVLARQNEEYAKRAHRLKKKIVASKWGPAFTEDQRGDIKQFTLRGRVHKRLKKALDAVARDEHQIEQIIERAQQDASEEISMAVSSKLIELAVDKREPDYEQHRGERLEALVLINLAILKAKHDALTQPEFNEY